jgi:asparagine synthase (glutamine-hydrolysing)
MCGIVGWINAPELNQEDMDRSLKAIHHRGPDASGTYFNKSDALGHVRLSIQDLSTAANQPMEGKDWVLAFNGEVYNFPELREKYQLECSTTSDTEVVLKGFEKNGIDFFSEMNGMFALALYHKSSGKLVLCRDRVGIKPLYLLQIGNTFAFASELKALKGLYSIKSKLNISHQAVSDFFHLGYIPSPQTIYKEIIKFPSGHFAEIDNGKLKVTEYWSVERNIEKDKLTNESEAKQTLKGLLTDSVKFRLRSDVPFGTFLSGGIDSSLVTSIAQNQSSNSLNTFSIGFQESSHNEAEHAKEIAKSLGTNHHEFYVSEDEAKELVPGLVNDYDEPYADSSAIPTMLVSKMARQHVKMTLSGDGGDELFMGYGFYNWAKRLSNPVLSGLSPIIGSVLKQGDLRMKRAAEMFLAPKKQRQSHIFASEQYYNSQKEINELLVVPNVVSSYLNSILDSPRTLTPAEKQSFFDMKYYLKDELLTKVDVASMKFSLEDRVPILDHRIVEFALNLDESLKFKNGEQKYLLKQVLFDYLDPELFNRPKRGFSIPLATWLKGPLRSFMDEMLSSEVTKKVGFLVPSKVQEVKDAFLGGKNYYFNRIWLIMIFHHWYLENVTR